MERSDRKTALITGASRGLGRQIALTLARNSFSVIVNYLSSEKERAAVVDEVGRNSLLVRADMREPEQVKATAEKTKATFGRLDAVIYNAGITKDRLLLNQTEEDWDDIINTNLTGCFHIIKYLAPLLIDAGGGHIITISSYSGVKGKSGQAAYSASKQSCLGSTLCCLPALSLKPGIR